MNPSPIIYALYANHTNSNYHTNIYCRHNNSYKWCQMKKEQIPPFLIKGPQTNESHHIYIYKFDLSELDLEIDRNSIKIKAISNKGTHYHDAGETLFPDELPAIFLRFDLKFNMNYESCYRNPPDTPIQSIQNQILFFVSYFLDKEKEHLEEVLGQIDRKISRVDNQNLLMYFEYLLSYPEVCTVLMSLNSFKKVLNMVNIKNMFKKIVEIIEILKKKLNSIKKNEDFLMPIMKNSLNCLLTLILVTGQIEFNDFEKIYNKCPKTNLEEYLLDEIVRNNVSFKNNIEFANFKQLFPKNMDLERLLELFFSYNSDLDENLKILATNIKNLQENTLEELMKKILCLKGSKKEIKLFLGLENQKEKTIEIFKYLRLLVQYIDNDELANILKRLLSEIEDNGALMIFNKEWGNFKMNYENELMILQTIKDKYKEKIRTSCQKSFICLLKEDFKDNFIKNIYFDEKFRKDLVSIIENTLRKDKKILIKERENLVKLLFNKDLSFIRITKGEIVKMIFELIETEADNKWFIEEFLISKNFPELYFEQYIKFALSNLMKLYKDKSSQISYIKKLIGSLGLDEQKINYNEFILGKINDKFLPEILFLNIGKYKPKDINFLSVANTIIEKNFAKLKPEKFIVYLQKLLVVESENEILKKKPELTENQLTILRKLLDLSPSLIIEESEILVEGFAEKLKVFRMILCLINNKDLDKAEYLRKSLTNLKLLKEKILNEEITYKTCENLQRNMLNMVLYEEKLKILTISKEEFETLKKKIGEILKKFQDFKTSLISFNILITRYFKRCSDSETLLKDYQKMSENINEMLLKDLKFPEDFLKFKDLAKFLNEVDKSVVFQSIFFAKIKIFGQKPLEIVEILTILTETRQEFEVKVKSLCDPNKTTMKQLQDLFRDNEKEAQKELKFFGEMFKLSADQQQEILNSLKSLDNVNNYLEIIESYQLLIEHFIIEKGELSQKLLKGKELLLDNKLSLRQFMQKFPNLEEIINKKFLKSPENAKNTKFLAIFKEMARNLNLLKFVQDKKSDDFRQLMENNENLEDELFKVESIISLIKVQKFIHELKNLIEKKNEEESLIVFFFELINKNDQFYDKLDADIYLASNSLSQIMQRFNQQRMDKSEANKTKILRILDKSSLKIIRPSKNDLYTCEIQIEGPLKEKIAYNDLIEMRDISLLYTQNSLSNAVFENRDNKNADLAQRFSFFKEIVDYIRKLIDLFREILVTGNPLFDEIILKITFNQKVKDDIENLVRKYTELYEKWNQQLSFFYEESFLNCFLYGKHIETLYLESTNQEKNKTQSDFICNYIQNMKHHVNLAQSFKKMDPEINVFKFLMETAFILRSHRMELLNNFAQYQFQHLGSNNIYTFNTLDRNFCVYTFLLKIYLQFTNNLPIPQLILNCNRNTSESEIRVFFSRCMKCPLKLLFSIIRLDELEANLQISISEKLMEFNSNFEKNRSSILLINPAHAIAFMKQMNNLKTEKLNFREDEVLDEKLQGFILNKVPFKILIMKSLLSGFGKSFSIQQECLKYHGNLKNLKYFPLAGTFEPNLVINRLIELNIGPNDCLHVDLGKFNEWAELKELMFSLIFYQGLFLSQSFYILPTKLEIFIELDNSENHNYKENLNFLRFFKEDMKNQRIPLEINPKHENFKEFNLVCLYLELFENDQINNIQVDYEMAYETPYSIVKGRVLLDKYFNLFKKDQKAQYTNYQVLSFMKSLALSLNHFSKNFCFNIEYLKESGIDVNLRKQTVENLILNASCFSMLNSSYLIDLQNKNIDAIAKNDDESEEDLIKTHSFISFNKLQHLILCFDDKGYELLAIQKDLGLINDNLKSVIKNLETLFAMNDKSQKALLKNYKDMKSENLLAEMLHFLTLDPNKKLLLSDYVMMVLIYLKTKCGIPVIMMGETGCGKTRLLKFLTNSLLEVDLKIINFHAGIDEETIVRKIKAIIETHDPAYKEWVFLDEINTCQHLGLISEIILKNSLLGEKLPKNLQFIAACNPYRIRKNKTLNIVGLTAKGSSNRKENDKQLAYTVYPLPHAIMNFVFDFGALDIEDIKKYIDSMVDKIDDKSFKDLAVDCLCSSHNFIIELEETSSVSLRDINRFMVFYNWFKKSIISRKPPTRKGFFSYLMFWNNYEIAISDSEATKNALVLSLIMIYYVRLDSAENRKLYIQRICEQFKRSQHYLSPEKFLEIYEKEQMDYISRMTINKGIALNTALRENLFILLVSICNHIPLIICGKPGCSKTLSVRLLYDNMRGSDSNDEFFKALPRLYLVSYQGSLASSSQSIEKIFQRAYKINKSLLQKKEDGRVVVFFDELGLAELSKLNPLKVLHELLEPDKFDETQKEKVVGFVGISNWRLDASNMNRAIFLARPDPNCEDLEKTAVEISQSYLGDNSIYERYFKYLAQTYYRYKNYLEGRIGCEDLQEFHGGRDFFHLIKDACKKFMGNKRHLNDEEIYKEIIEICLEKNFGGINLKNFNSQIWMKNFYKEVLSNSGFGYLINEIKKVKPF